MKFFNLIRDQYRGAVDSKISENNVFFTQNQYDKYKRVSDEALKNSTVGFNPNDCDLTLNLDVNNLYFKTIKNGNMLLEQDNFRFCFDKKII